MSKKFLFAALFALCMLVTGVAVADEAQAPQACAVQTLATDAGTAVLVDDGAFSLEDLLADLTPDTSTGAIDSGICCSSSSDCDDVSGYYKRCSSGSCNNGPYSCLYRRK